MAAILVFFCLIANWPFWPLSSLKRQFARRQKNTKMAAILEKVYNTMQEQVKLDIR